QRRRAPAATYHPPRNPRTPRLAHPHRRLRHAAGRRSRPAHEGGQRAGVGRLEEKRIVHGSSLYRENRVRLVVTSSHRVIPAFALARVGIHKNGRELPLPFPLVSSRT